LHLAFPRLKPAQRILYLAKPDVGGFSTDWCFHMARGSLDALLQIIDEIYTGR
jgi:hypothetical protein